MIFVTDGAEIKFQKALLHAKDKKTGIKCMMFKTSGLPDNTVYELVRAITETIEDTDGVIFECEDGDIYVLAQDMIRRSIEKLSVALNKKSISLPEASLFDPSLDWAVISASIEEKILYIKKNAREEKEISEEKKRERLSSWIMNMKFDPELLKAMQEKRKSHERSHVLIIEDDLFTRNLLKSVLKDTCEVTNAGDGYSAISKYPYYAPDIVFLDIDLPDINGLNILRKILSFDPETFIVMLSGHSNRDNIINAIENGAKGFVGKPFTKDKIIHYIQKSLKKNLNKDGTCNEVYQ